MRVRTPSRARPVIYAAAAALCLCFVASLPVRGGPVLPGFSPSNFTPGAPIDNPYFPLVPGTLFRSRGVATDPDSGEQSVEVDEDFVTFMTEEIAGVTTRLVRARVFSDGLLTEDTIDRYAQDKSGNVWYFGEDTTEFERDDEGNVIGTDTSGSWRAGVNGALPGFIMPADRPIGFNYFQEFAEADDALDQATVLATDETVDVPAGHFTKVLKTKDFTELEPDVVENKYYAPGVGLILTEDLNDDGSVAASFALESVSVAAIPLPPAVWPGLIGLVIVAGALSRRRGWNAGSGRRSTPAIG